MDCVRAQKLIRPYLDGKLSDRELEEFLDHVESCPACMTSWKFIFPSIRRWVRKRMTVITISHESWTRSCRGLSSI